MMKGYGLIYGRDYGRDNGIVVDYRVFKNESEFVDWLYKESLLEPIRIIRIIELQNMD